MDNQRKKKLSTLADSELLEVLAAFANEAAHSLDNKAGLRAASYLRYIKQALDLRKIKPVSIDDIDIERDTIYLSA